MSGQAIPEPKPIFLFCLAAAGAAAGASIGGFGGWLAGRCPSHELFWVGATWGTVGGVLGAAAGVSLAISDAWRLRLILSPVLGWIALMGLAKLWFRLDPSWDRPLGPYQVYALPNEEELALYLGAPACFILTVAHAFLLGVHDRPLAAFAGYAAAGAAATIPLWSISTSGDGWGLFVLVGAGFGCFQALGAGVAVRVDRRLRSRR